jgi:hypothetical protein
MSAAALKKAKEPLTLGDILYFALLPVTYERIRKEFGEDHPKTELYRLLMEDAKRRLATHADSNGVS